VNGRVYVVTQSLRKDTGKHNLEMHVINRNAGNPILCRLGDLPFDYEAATRAATIREQMNLQQDEPLNIKIGLEHVVVLGYSRVGVYNHRIQKTIKEEHVADASCAQLADKFYGYVMSRLSSFFLILCDLKSVCKRVYFQEKMFAIQKLFIWSFIAFSDPLLTSHSIKIITYNLIYFVG
jgi:hypothetical protein